MKNAIKKRENISFYFLMFLFFLVSGTTFGYLHAYIIDSLFLFSSVVYYTKNNKYVVFSKDKSCFLAFLLIAWSFNYIIHINGNPPINTYACYIIRFVACFFFCSSIGETKFRNGYLKIMFLISVFSLICFFSSQIYGVSSLATTNVKQGSYFTTLLFYNYNGYEINRNSGIFWEPGAYQLFLSLAILFEIKRNDFILKKIITLNSIIFLISMITTKSTAGYFSLIILLAFVMYKNWYYLNFKMKFYFTIPLIILSVLLIYNIIISDVVTNKLFMYNNSFNIRLNDFIQSFEAMRLAPVLGHGVGTESYIRISNFLEISTNSVGIFCTAIYLGIPYTIYFVYRIMRNAFQEKDIMVPFCLLLVLSMFTEDFFRYGIYFCLGFGFRRCMYERNSKEILL